MAFDRLLFPCAVPAWPGLRPGVLLGRGTARDGAAALAVIFDPSLLLDESDVELYVYDDDEDGSPTLGYGISADDHDDGFDGEDTIGPIYGDKYDLTPFARAPEGDEPDDVWIPEIAVSAIDGAPTAQEAALRLFRLVNQRLEWSYSGFLGRLPVQRYLSPHVAADGRTTVAGISAADARTFSRPGSAMPAEKTTKVQCVSFAMVLAGLSRSVGIPARAAYSGRSSRDPGVCQPIYDWGNYHAWTEVALAGSGVLPPGSGASWYVFDATDLCEACSGVFSNAHAEEAVDTRGDYVRSSTTNPSYPAAPCVKVWDPVFGPPEFPFQDVTDFYVTDPEVWIRHGTIGGLFGRGDIDYFRLGEAGVVVVGFDAGVIKFVAAACPAARVGYPYATAAVSPTPWESVTCPDGSVPVFSELHPPSGPGRPWTLESELDGAPAWYVALFRQQGAGAASGNVGAYTVTFGGVVVPP